MITSKQINNLLEDWDRSIKYGKLSIDIFTNPNSSDLKELYSRLSKDNPRKEIRFIANAKDKKVYVWDAALVHHDAVSQQLGFTSGGPSRGLINHPSYALDGFGIISGGKILGEDNNGTISDLKTSLQYNLIDKGKKSKLDYWSYEEWESRIKEVFNWNWSFIDSFVSGYNQYLNKIKSDFIKWENS